MLRDDALNVYVDGSSYSAPRRGGIGIRLVTTDHLGHEVTEDFPRIGYQSATNNEMEIVACIEGLKVALKHPALGSATRICIISDSRYVTDNWQKALVAWPKQKWVDRSGRPLENVDLWKDLASWIRKARTRVEIVWERGKTNPNNKAVDKLAKASAKGALLKQPLRQVTVRKKLSSGEVERGSIPMLGQTLDIRVITDTRLPQRVYRYKYEVLPSSPDLAGNVDLAFSTHFLMAGHHYRVTVGTDAKNPRIDDVHKELERVRLARNADISVMHQIRMAVKENQLRSRVLSESDYRKAIRLPGRGWVVDVEGVIAGFAVVNGETGNVWALFVHPDYEKRGYGRQLHQAMLTWLGSRGVERAWLTTDPGTRASRFYEAAGWVALAQVEGGEVRFEKPLLETRAVS